MLVRRADRDLDGLRHGAVVDRQGRGARGRIEGKARRGGRGRSGGGIGPRRAGQRAAVMEIDRHVAVLRPVRAGHRQHPAAGDIGGLPRKLHPLGLTQRAEILRRAQERLARGGQSGLLGGDVAAHGHVAGRRAGLRQAAQVHGLEIAELVAVDYAKRRGLVVGKARQIVARRVAQIAVLVRQERARAGEKEVRRVGLVGLLAYHEEPGAPDREIGPPLSGAHGSFGADIGALRGAHARRIDPAIAAQRGGRHHLRKAAPIAVGVGVGDVLGDPAHGRGVGPKTADTGLHGVGNAHVHTLLYFSGLTLRRSIRSAEVSGSGPLIEALIHWFYTLSTFIEIRRECGASDHISLRRCAVRYRSSGRRPLPFPRSV